MIMLFYQTRSFSNL